MDERNTIAENLPADVAALPAAADTARTELDRLKADKDWVARHMSGDHNTKADVERLSAIIAAPPAGTTMHGGPTVEAQRNEQADWVAENFPVSQAVIEEIKSGAPETPEIYRQAVALKKSWMKDPEWVDLYMRGSPKHRKDMLLANVIISNGVRL